MSALTFTSFDGLNSFPALWANRIPSEEKTLTTHTIESGDPAGGRTGTPVIPQSWLVNRWPGIPPQKVFQCDYPLLLANQAPSWQVLSKFGQRPGAPLVADKSPMPKLTQRKTACLLE